MNCKCGGEFLEVNGDTEFLIEGITLPVKDIKFQVCNKCEEILITFNEFKKIRDAANNLSPEALDILKKKVYEGIDRVEKENPEKA